MRYHDSSEALGFILVPLRKVSTSAKTAFAVIGMRAVDNPSFSNCII